ncbi:ABC transporter permease [Tanticharoenia sakaeratensis]|uniref:ABC transporter permease protein yufP n=1 Tax=Tanticharoenia sakaeratensis NBRC 103193 TaxID=1231623 RepID=A0A0D6ML23_9PROT|nr:ABC transporter permease [Tanticharoenia sakaeratensis]GAN54322.1 ABC transporter permease protein yufP [Tanticharoenia sakaeratensis NBRC 103193]GBQ18952.1 ABC transporter permease [Tanticharoenia sakaeratensis NBRC 103193]
MLRERWRQGLAVACLVALTIGLLLPFHVAPWRAWWDIATYAVRSRHGLSAALIAMAPLEFCALATIVCWRSGLLYLGFDGCYLGGALGAILTAIVWPGLSPWAFLPLSLIFAFALGGFWASLTGIARARFGGNEVLGSLMMNFVAIFIVQYLVSGPIRAGSDLPQTAALARAQWMPRLAGLHAHVGVLVAVLAAILLAGLLSMTRAGYVLRMTGLGPQAARYGGIATGLVWVMAAIGGGGLAGLGGWCDVLGLQHRLIDGMGQGIGFQGIVVAILAGLHPLRTVPVAFIYAALIAGGGAMQRDFQIPSAIVSIFESLLVLTALALPALRRGRLTRA